MNKFHKKDFLFGSTNKNKYLDVLRIAQRHGFSIFNLKNIAESGLKIQEYPPEVDETENTYLGNALLKARAYCSWANLPTIADDSGLEVEALDGAPGIFSARFAGVNATDDLNNQKLLSLLINKKNRKAKMISTIVLTEPSGITIITEGELLGEIIDDPRGESGWGYEPIFLLPQFNKTIAELRDEDINFPSHRKIAAEKLFSFIA